VPVCLILDYRRKTVKLEISNGTVKAAYDINEYARECEMTLDQVYAWAKNYAHVVNDWAAIEKKTQGRQGSGRDGRLHDRRGERQARRLCGQKMYRKCKFAAAQTGWMEGRY
jgi:hypothetical protein